MAHDVRSPHIFVDGPGNTASGDQVMDNFDALWTARDALLSAHRHLLTGVSNFNSTIGGPQTYGTSRVTGVWQSGVTNVVQPDFLVFDPADYLVSGKTTRLFLRLMLLVNGTAPAMNFSASLAPLTSGGGANVLTPTMGTLVTGSTTSAITTPAANSKPSVSATFDAPAADTYAPVIGITGTPAANSVVAATTQLFYFHV